MNYENVFNCFLELFGLLRFRLFVFNSPDLSINRFRAIY
jgi:hypothetical protein